VPTSGYLNRELRAALIATWLGLFFSFFYIASAKGTLSFGDDVSMFRVTRSIATEMSVAVPADTPGVKRGVDGRYYSKFGLGQSVLGLPFYLVGAFIQDHYSNPVLRNAYGETYANPVVFCVCLLGIFSMVGAIVLLYLSCLTLGFDERASIVAALAFGGCTFAWYYARTFMTEPSSTFFLILAFYSLLRFTRGRRSTWLSVSGLGLGFAIWVRLENAIVLPTFAIWLMCELCVWQKRDLKDGLAAAAAWSVPVLASFAVIAAYNYLRFRSMTDSGFEPQLVPIIFQNPLYVGLCGFLLSSGKSIFWYAPILLPAVYGWRFLWKRLPRITAMLGIQVGSYLLFYSHVHWWYGGGAWGPRCMVQMLPFLMIGLAALIDHGLGLIGWIGVGTAAALSLFIQITSVLVSNFPYEALMERTPEAFDRLLWAPAYSPIIIQSGYLIHHKYPYDLACNAYPSPFLAHLQLSCAVAAITILGAGISLFFGPRGKNGYFLQVERE
jgi:hypothetical protein